MSSYQEMIAAQRKFKQAQEQQVDALYKLASAKNHYQHAYEAVVKAKNILVDADCRVNRGERFLIDCRAELDEAYTNQIEAESKYKYERMIT